MCCTFGLHACENSRVANVWVRHLTGEAPVDVCISSIYRLWCACMCGAYSSQRFFHVCVLLCVLGLCSFDKYKFTSWKWYTIKYTHTHTHIYFNPYDTLIQSHDSYIFTRTSHNHTYINTHTICTHTRVTTLYIDCAVQPTNRTTEKKAAFGMCLHLNYLKKHLVSFFYFSLKNAHIRTAQLILYDYLSCYCCCFFLFSVFQNLSP